GGRGPAFNGGGGRAAAGRAVMARWWKASAGGRRERRKPASTADLISIEACAEALAALRGHSRVWRRDLTDAITAALVKDDVHLAHPFILALQEELRGGERGRPAGNAPPPPLVRDIQARLTAARPAP